MAPAAHLARVEAGALWGDVVAAAAEHGLMALAGSSHDVGAVGYSLGGGISWLARKHGLSANSVVAADVVTADGRLRQVNSTHEPELFWALRGGGGNVAAVAALEIRLHPMRDATAGALLSPRTGRGGAEGRRRWVPGVPRR